MSKNSVMTKKSCSKLFTLVSALLLSACVTQSFENDTPIVENNVSNNEIAATRISLGLGYLNMGNMTQAKLNLEKAKRFAPNLVQVYTAFAHYYETVGEIELTEQAFEKALSIASDDADTLNNYGVFLCRQDKVKQAEKQFLKAIVVPSYLLVAQSYENLASCFLQIDDFTKAEKYLIKAIAHSPNRTVTLLQMVRLQYAMGQYKQAKKFQQKFERNTNRFSPTPLSLAYKLYWKLGERKKAKNYANMLVRMYPQSWESKQYLLNDLEQIQADDLAKRYNITQRINNSALKKSSPKKRVVKLSPKKRNDIQVITKKKKIVIDPLVDESLVTTSPEQISEKTGGLLESLANEAKDTHAINTVKLASKEVVTNNLEKIIDTSEGQLSSVELEVEVETPAALIVSTAAVVATQSSKDKSVTLLDNELDNTVDPQSKTLTSNSADTVTAITSTHSQTFTDPVPAKRDAPLPEVIEYVEDNYIIDSTTINKVNSDIKVHTVKKGDNLYAISIMYNVKVSALTKWNNISIQQNLPVGKKLYIENPETVNNINE